MKKILFSFLMLFFVSTFANAACNIENKDCNLNKPEIKSDCNKSENCNKCMIDDDEYCIYNQCFLDKQYRKMKKELCLTKNQECKIDNVYRTFKNDMENRCNRYKIEKNKLLEMLECNNDCYKDQIKVLKKMKKDTKERIKDYGEDIKDQLCRNQYSDFRKYKRCQKRKLKKMIKYGAIYKLPCVDCCK